MKILQVGGLAGPGPIAGGVWAVAESQAKALRGRGHQVTLVGGWMGDEPPGPDFIRVRELFPGAGLRGLYAAGLEQFLLNAAQGVDAVHIHLSRDYLTTTALKVLRHHPIVVQPHGMIRPGGGLLVRMFDAMYRKRFLAIPKIWLVLTASEATGLSDFGVKSRTMIRIDNAVEDPGMPVEPQPNDQVVFSFISRLHPRKQPGVFVEAGVELLRDTRARFRLVGPDQGARADVERLAAATSTEAFTFVGAVDRAGVRAELRRADVIVLPSRGEVAPMIAIEAAAAGRAQILTSDCGLAESFSDAGAAIVVEPDVASVARAMRVLARDSGLRASIGLAGRALFEDRWSLASLGEELERAYGQLIQVSTGAR